MDKISRYLLLVFIIIIFIILAPLIVIYVSGKNIELGDRLTKDTGIIDIQSTPSDAEVYIDSTKNNNTPTTVRFVKQGIHTIEIRKTGFRPWHKSLYIEAGKVSYAGSLSNEVKLLLDKPPLLLDNNPIESYVLLGDRVVFHTSDTLIKYDLSEQRIIQQIQLPVTISKLTLTNTDNYLLATAKNGRYVLITTEDLKLTNLPDALASGVTNIELGPKDAIFAIKDKALLVSTGASTPTTPLLENVLAFTLHDNTMYIASQATDTFRIDTYLWDGNSLTLQNNLITQNLGLGKQYKLWLTFQKELFLWNDGNFYRVNQSLDLLNKSVTNISLDKPHRQLTYQTPSEIYYYNFISGKAELFYRTTGNSESNLVVPNTGYGFLASKNGLEAIEIDNRNGQNHYLLLADQPVSDITITNDEQSILFLNNKKLYQIQISQ